MNGLYFLNVASTKFLLVVEPNIEIMDIFFLLNFFNLSPTLKRANSFCSNIIICEGSKSTNWDTISDPIDPPPPVIKTIFLNIFFDNRTLSDSTIFLFKNSDGSIFSNKFILVFL